MTSFAKIDKTLVEENASQIIELAAAEISEHKAKIESNRQEALEKYQSFSWLKKFLFEGKDNYIRNTTNFEQWELETKIDKLTRTIKNARGLLMLATKTKDGYVSLSPSDARFLNIDPDVYV